MGLNEDFNSTQQLTITDLQILKSTLDSLVEWQFECIDSNKRAYDSIQSISQGIDLKGDLLSFARFIQVTGDFIRDDGIESLIQSSSSGSSGAPPSTVGGSATGSSSGNSAFLSKVGQSMLIDIPQIDLFEPIKNVTVDEERKNISMQYSRSLSYPVSETSNSGAGTGAGAMPATYSTKHTRPSASEEPGSDMELAGGDEIDTSSLAGDGEGGPGSGPPRKPSKPKQSAAVSSGNQQAQQQQKMSQTIAAAVEIFPLQI